ncbi:TBC-domain-containing protein [Hesseltinella vesiculosa]|uniref:TBC-domain-containing protein n=1 Tax=Hesseltinella vesiculosa TaxID=101127 RepID=A0A1X2GVC1_9FUNG|nr:TBC-domain-containing protein [Hesseltinella vesiculosa]
MASSTLSVLTPRPSASTKTLADRRRVPTSPEKLKVFTSLTYPKINIDTSSQPESEHMKTLEQENAKLAPQASEDYLLAHLERQNALLQADPKSISMEANRLQADFKTLKQLVQDNSTMPSAGVLSTPDMINHTQDAANVANISDWDFWQCLVDDYPAAVAKLPHLISAKLCHGGIPHPLRGVLWQAMSHSSSTRLESIYDDLVSKDEDSPYARVIQRDLSRTFPSVDMFKSDGGQGQQAMQRILTSYSIYDVQVGYCQGLAFLVGPLLMTMTEKQAFCAFIRLMETYELRTMFTLNMEGLHLRLHQFESLLAQCCPELNDHLARHSIHPPMYASQWYLTLFAYSLPIHVVMRIYDLVFAEGAVETVTRVAIALMRKNEQALLAIHDFEQLMIYLSSKELFEKAYGTDSEALIQETMSLSNTITKPKLDSIADMHTLELEQEKTRVHQFLALRFGSNPGSKRVSASGSKKRESWFTWNKTATPSAPPAALDSQPTSPTSTSPVPVPVLSPAPMLMDRTVPKLHEQIEDLVVALSQLQKEHSQLSEQLMAMKMDAMDYTTMNEKLMDRNSLLTRRLKKYKQLHRRANHSGSSPPSSPQQAHHQRTSSSVGSSQDDLMLSPSSVDTSFSSLIDKANASRLQVLEKETEFTDFVASLQQSGDFGNLIASALTWKDGTPPPATYTTKSTPQPADGHDDDDDLDDLDDDVDQVLDQEEKERQETMTTVTQELVQVKLANFEMGQKFESICHENITLKHQVQGLKDKERMYLDQLNLLEKVRSEQEEEVDRLARTNDTLSERLVAIKQTSADIEMEKLSLTDRIKQLSDHVDALEQEKRDYLKPRDSFSEEVFAAHQTLFGDDSVYKRQEKKQHTINRRSMSFNGAVPDLGDDQPDPSAYQRKYVEAELRCRELEKLLAEAKFKLVQYETTPSMPTSPHAHNGRPMSFTLGSRAMMRDDSTATRASTDSLSTTTSSKRSSMYSRLWSTIASPTTPSATDLGAYPTKATEYQAPTIVENDSAPA